MKSSDKIILSLLLISVCTLSCTSEQKNTVPRNTASEQIDLGTQTPAPNTPSAWHPLEIQDTPTNSTECQDFKNFTVNHAIDKKYIGGNHKPLEPFKTDGVVVMKNGRIVYEWYDGVVTPDSPHVLWSASKMITGTLLGRLIQKKAKYNGRVVTLNTKLKEFFPAPGLGQNNSPISDNILQMKVKYDQITLGQLVEMSAGFTWKEYYDEDVSNSSFLPMLYTKTGRQNMADFALNVPMIDKIFPGEQYNYSGGNMNILMAVLGKIYANGEKAKIPNMANDLLFHPLDITSARIEQDENQNNIGSSYVYMTLRDMAKLGQFFLMNGKTPAGQNLLPHGWVQAAQEFTPVALNDKTPIDIIKKAGAPSKRIFWLNKDVVRNGQIAYPKEMPEAPDDMYFAAGHYGQLIIVIPSQNIVIARTGYDAKYWDHVQPFVVKTLSCMNENYKPNPVKDLTPPSAGEKKSWAERQIEFINSAPGLLKTLGYLQDQGIAGTNIAKEMCSFLFVQNAADNIPESEFISEYKRRSGFPAIAMAAILKDLRVTINKSEKSVLVRQFAVNLIGAGEKYRIKAVVDHNPLTGCRLEFSEP